MARTRAFRRVQSRKKKRRAHWFLLLGTDAHDGEVRDMRPDRSGREQWPTRRWVGTFADNLQRCSCMGCSQGRRHHGPTIQECRATEAFPAALANHFHEAEERRQEELINLLMAYGGY